ncbi:MAG: hypothetical protein WAU03_01980 [Candidatus Saccharimonas aalborgensis]
MKHEIYLLPEDRAYAQQRIATLEKEIQDLGVDFQDAFTQSSETWHDNSPFEAVRDKQAMLAAELHRLRSLIRASTLQPPKKKRGTVGIGDTVVLSDGKRYMIAGDWTHKAGQHSDGVIWVSCHAPIAKQLIAKKVGELVELGPVLATISCINLAK